MAPQYFQEVYNVFKKTTALAVDELKPLKMVRQRRTFQRTADLSAGIYKLVSRVPSGKVVTYGQIAKSLKITPRMVGRALSKNTDTKNIPCHRVVAANGHLTGYAFGGIEEKKKKLLEEGVQFTGDKVDLSPFAKNRVRKLTDESELFFASEGFCSPTKRGEKIPWA